MTAELGVIVNGRSSMKYETTVGLTVREDLMRLVARMDGSKFFAVLFWPLPAGVPFDLVDPNSETAGNYLQCAGGLRGRFTCEVRVGDATSGFGQFVIGRGVELQANGLTEVVTWDGGSVHVRPNEVLHDVDVVDLMHAYIVSGGLPPGYVSRALPSP